MNLHHLINNQQVKDIETHRLLSDKGSATLMSIKAGKVLREHQSVSQAVLLLVSGKATYEEKDRVEELAESMDFVEIPPHVTHKVTAAEDSLFLLIH